MRARYFSNYHVKKKLLKNLKIVKQNGKILQVSTNIQFSHYLFSPYQQPLQYLTTNQKYNVRSSLNLVCLAFTKAGGGIIEIDTCIYRFITQYCHEKAIKYLRAGSF